MKLKERFPSVYECYQCMTCTLGCPLARKMEVKPHELVKSILLGKDEEVLRSDTPWICASCEACATRCPNGIELVNLMDLIRREALVLGVIRPKEKDLYKAFMDQIMKRGRVQEFWLVLQLKKTEGFKVSLEEVMLGLRMFLKGKLNPFSNLRKGSKDLETAFREVSR